MADPVLTIYSYRHYESDRALFDQFTEATGIEVELVSSKADALIERLKSEGENSPADILLSSDVGRLHQAKVAGLLQPVTSDFLSERIPENLRDAEGFWFGVSQRARVIVYAPDRVDASELSTYEALAGPEWRGRLAVRSSSNIYNQSLLAMLIAENGEEQAEIWAKEVRRNMARPPQGSDREQMSAVAAGLADATLVNTYYLGLLQHSESEKDREVAEQLKIFFPNQDGYGTHVNVSGAGVVASSDTIEAARKFIEFLVTDEVQAVFPNTTYEYPVVESVPWSPTQQAWGAFKANDIALSKVGELNKEAIRIFNRAGWE